MGYILWLRSMWKYYSENMLSWNKCHWSRKNKSGINSKYIWSAKHCNTTYQWFNIGTLLLSPQLLVTLVTSSLLSSPANRPTRNTRLGTRRRQASRSTCSRPTPASRDSTASRHSLALRHNPVHLSLAHQDSIPQRQWLSHSMGTSHRPTNNRLVMLHSNSMKYHFTLLAFCKENLLVSGQAGSPHRWSVMDNWKFFARTVS